jgi:5-methylcytosine-specific restriction protein B
MVPALETEGFKAYQAGLGSELFDRFMEGVKQLNKVIAKDDSLGRGFCIGHSYFCNRTRFEKGWLENVLEYDIEPMLREYWFDDAQKYEGEMMKLRNILK